MAATKSQIQSLSVDVQQKVQSWLAALETSWGSQRLSAIVALLPESGDPLRRVALSEIIKADMNQQWQAGQEARLEGYLETYPELGTTENVPAELVHAEYEARRQAGRSPDINELAGRFPAQAEVLKALVETWADAPTPSDEKPPRASVETESSRVSTHSELKSPTAAQELPAQFGRYRVEKKLGQGAMGAVYLARDTELGRKVALKVPKFSETERPKLIERFYREARAAATLHHQHICTVYDVGEIDGIRFISMAYIEGKPMSAYIHPDKLQSSRQVAQVMRKLARALDEAHTAGIIHRDLKPANIMFDKKREPIIMDFGLARQVDQDADQSRLTQEGVVIGTPAYMAPEQVKADLDQMGPATDVYSLGIILYELLTGRLPFEGPIAAVLGQVLTVDAEAPSTINPDVDRQLEAICLKAISKEIEDRYQSMGEFAEAFTEWLRGKLAPGGQGEEAFEARSAAESKEAEMSAQIASLAAKVQQPQERLRRGRPVRKKSRPAPNTSKPMSAMMSWIPPEWRLIAGASAAALVLLIASIVMFFRTEYGTVKIEIDDPNATVLIDGDEIEIRNLGKPIRLSTGEHKLIVKRGDEEIEARTFRIIKDKSQLLELTLLDADSSGDLAAQPSATQSKDEFYASFPVGQPRKLDFCWGNRFEGGPSIATGMLELFFMAIDPSGPGREDLFVARRSARSEPFRDIAALRKAGSSEHEYNPFVSADGLSLFFTSARSGNRDIYVSTRSHVGAEFDEAQPLTGANTDQIESRPIVSADGNTLLFLRLTKRDASDAEMFQASLTYEGDRVIASNVTKTNLPTCAHPVAIGNRGSVLFAQTDQKSLRYGMAELYATWSNTGPANFVNPVEIMSIGNGEWNTLTSLTADARVMFFRSGLDIYSMRLPDVTAATIRRVLAWKPGDPPPIRGDASQETVGGSPLADGPPGELRVMIGHTDQINAVGFSPDGKKIVSCSGRRRESEEDTETANGTYDYSIRIWDTRTGSQLRQLSGHEGPVNDVCFSPDGTCIASCGGDKTIRIWNAESGREEQTLAAGEHNFSCLSFTADGHQIISGSGNATVQIWDVISGEVKGRFRDEHTKSINDIAILHGGQEFLCASFQDIVRVELQGGKATQRFRIPRGFVSSLSVSPNGRYAASTAVGNQVFDYLGRVPSDTNVRLWELTSGLEIRQFQGHDAETTRVVFCPDGEHILTSSYDSTVRMWNIETGDEVHRFGGHLGRVFDVAVSPDGRFAVSGGIDMTVRLLRLPIAPDPATTEENKARSVAEIEARRQWYLDEHLMPLKERHGEPATQHDRWLPPIKLGSRINEQCAWLPTLSPDGKELYYSMGFTGRSFYKQPAIYRALWNGDRWSNPNPVLLADGQPLVGKGVTISADGKLMALIAWKQLVPNHEYPYPGSPDSYPKLDNYGDGDVYICERENGIWQSVRNAGPEINRLNETGVAFVPGSYDLCIAASKPKVFPQLWLATWDGDHWGNPMQMRLGRAGTPVFSPDNTKLYFTSRRRGNYGRRADIWMSKRQDAGWTEPTNLGPAVNHPHSDGHPTLSPDGTILYYNRHQPWKLYVTGKANSEVAIRHMAEIYALGEWEVEGPPVAAPSLEAAKSISDLASYRTDGSVSGRDEWRSLFNGKDLTGWKVIGESKWNVEEGAIHATEAGRPFAGWLSTRDLYSDFILTLEYMLPPGGQSGVFLRALRDGAVSGADFLEVQLMDDSASQYRGLGRDSITGAIFGIAPVTSIADAPVDKWNHLEVGLQGDRIAVKVNGQQLVYENLNDRGEYRKMRIDQSANRLRQGTGSIGLQHSGKGAKFRNIRIRELN